MPRRIWHLFRQAGDRFMRADGALVSAATAFYVFLSAAPLALLAIGIAGVVFGREAAREELYRRLRDFAGEQGATTMMGWFDSIDLEYESIWAAIAGIAVMFFAASRIFQATQRALNQIWGVRARRGSGLKSVTRSVIKKRLLSFTLVLVSGAALMLVLSAKTILASLRNFTNLLPAGSPLTNALEFIVLIGVMSLIFAFALRILPDARVGWKDAWFGASATSVMFAAGAFGAGMYTEHVASNSAYGVAGSLAIVLLWVYYSAQSFFFGAALTLAWAREFGQGVEPEPHATWLIEQPA